MKRSRIWDKKRVLLPVVVVSIIVTGSAFTLVNLFRPDVTNNRDAPAQTKTEWVKEQVVDEAVGQVQDAVIEQLNDGNWTASIDKEEGQTVRQEQGYSSNIAAKEQYLESLAYAYELDENAPNHEVSFNMGLGEAHEAWDNELNKIYGLLREKLSAEKMAALKKDELAWIKFRDRQVGDADTAGSWTVKERRILLTEERTLYLIDMYFDEPSSMRYVQLADEAGNIRQKPAIDSKVVYSGVMGDMFTYLQEKVNTADGRTWYKVEYSSGLVGYISHAVSNLTNETPKYVRLMEDNTKIRISPSLEADIITTGNRDQVFDYNDEQTHAADGRIWLRIDYADKYGYISQKVGTMTRSWGYEEF